MRLVVGPGCPCGAVNPGSARRRGRSSGREAPGPSGPGLPRSLAGPVLGWCLLVGGKTWVRAAPELVGQ